MESKLVIACPDCAEHDEIYSETTVLMHMVVAADFYDRAPGIPEGQVVAVNSVEDMGSLRQESPAFCNSCGYSGTLEDFTIEQETIGGDLN